jgi:integrase
VPVHVVAKRIGDDPATLLRFYATRTKKADVKAAEAIAARSKGVLEALGRFFQILGRCS